MPYTPENNPYIPGDPYSYDLKWMVDKFKSFEEPQLYADAAKASAEASQQSAENSEESAQNAHDSEIAAANSAVSAHNSEVTAKNYADNIADPVSGIVTDWLEENITITPGVVIDTSLSVAGAAADAEATGDAIDAVAADIDGAVELKNLCSPTTLAIPSNPGYAALVLDTPIEAGDYIFCAKITKADYTEPCFIAYSKSSSSQYGSNVIASGQIFPTSDSKAIMHVSLPETCRSLRLCSMANATQSNGYAADYDEIMICKEPNTIFTSKNSAVDTLARSYPCLLAPTGDSTNRAKDILEGLRNYGSVKLLPGDYHVGNLTMGTNQTLEGTNEASSRIICDVGGTSYGIRMNAGCVIRNLTILGDENDLTFDENSVIGSNRGIQWNGAAMENGLIENCIISNFDECAIAMYQTGTSYKRNMIISDCQISNSYIGIGILSDSEFNKIHGCGINSCRVGYLNRGGNNIISGCTIDGNVAGIKIDDAIGSNNGHGIIADCSINHSNNNTGYGLHIEGTGRMLIDSCNFYYSNVLLEDTNGNVLSGCGFGSDANIEIDGGQCSLISGCMFVTGDTITRTGNTAAVINGSYFRSGSPINFS